MGKIVKAIFVTSLFVGLGIFEYYNLLRLNDKIYDAYKKTLYLYENVMVYDALNPVKTREEFIQRYYNHVWIRNNLTKFAKWYNRLPKRRGYTRKIIVANDIYNTRYSINERITEGILRRAKYYEGNKDNFAIKE